ncbi:MAG: UDP-N-acetylmuramoyl-tripeptide--D-alanyl-D-alanine ligase [Polyangiaceae bacterium]|nr:UDP-N-acetylmuramoyl-tripeptide--D-alanyl-D-alanine ligase [Polyangiaceae bacterium]
MATPIPANRTVLTVTEIAQATGGSIRGGTTAGVQGVATDTRIDLRGKLFVALAGERFDGHGFVPQAVAGGGAGVMLSRDVPVPGGAFVVRVPDTLVALGELARFHRLRWGGRAVAIGGSAGKTTTRAVASALLSSVLGDEVAFQRGNLNNLVGVPMVLLTVAVPERVVVVEVGTNATGEVPRLARIVAPDVAVLTLIDLEHTEGLGDLDGIEQEEGSLLAALAPEGVAVGNVDDERVRRQLARSPARRRLGYGTNEAADYRIVARRSLGPQAAHLRLTRPTGDPLEVTTALLGLPGALAVAAGVAAVEAVLDRALSAGEVESALCRGDAWEPGRLTPVELADGTLVLDDTYNANPGSMTSSIEVAREMARERSARLVLVLGEMRELGALAVAEHRRLGADLVAVAPAAVVGVGGDAEHLVGAARAAGLVAEFAADASSAQPLVAAHVQAGDVVLVKASRGVRAERLVEGLVEARRGEP